MRWRTPSPPRPSGAALRVQLVRNGSRGAFWLEPLVEVASARGRVAYGPVTVADVAGLFAADFLHGGAHPLALGPTEEIPWFKGQQRLTFARVGIVDPASVADYVRARRLRGTDARAALEPAAIVQAVTDSGLRGRGGAAFPTGIKWKTVLDQVGGAEVRHLQRRRGRLGHLRRSHADGGRPAHAHRGHDHRRHRRRRDAGLHLPARRVSARPPRAQQRDRRGLPGALSRRRRARQRQALRPRGAARRRRLHLRRRDLDAREPRGQARRGARAAAAAGDQGPVRPADHRQQRDHARERADHPRARAPSSTPTTAWASRAARCRSSWRATSAAAASSSARSASRLRELLYDYGGGSASGRPIRAVQVGGPLGAYIPPAQFDTAVDYEAFAGVGALFGHGGIVVFDDTVDMARMARYAMEFCAIESCGKCTPCRIGSTRGVEVIDRILAGEDRRAQRALLEELCDTMLQGSLCGLGGMTPFPCRARSSTSGRIFTPHGH